MRIVRGPSSPQRRVTNPRAPVRTQRTKQEFKQEVDINYIVGRMKKGIQPPPWMTSRTPRFGDFTGLPTSLSECYDIVSRAEEAFESLPSEFRTAIDNDPRNIASAPRELFERFGLLKPDGKNPPTAGSLSSGKPEGQGDRDLPGKAPVGANKKAVKPSTTSDDQSE